MGLVGRYNKFYFILLVTLVFCSCSNQNEQKKVEPVNENKVVTRVIPPDFNSDTAFEYIKLQSEMGPRVPGTKSHEKAVQFYSEKLKSFGAAVELQKGVGTTYDNKKWELINIIASFNSDAVNRIALFAHYDSRPFCDRDSIEKNKKLPCPGINDGASGVGVILEMARQFGLKKPELGIDIILLDLEDYGDSDIENSWCLGAQHWMNNPHKPQYFARYGVLLDMVGAKGATFPMEEISLTYAGSAVAKIWTTAQNLGYGNYFVQERIGALTDDHLYINKYGQVPTLDIIHYDSRNSDFFQHHHRASDNLENIDKQTLKAVGQTLLEVIYNEKPDA